MLIWTTPPLRPMALKRGIPASQRPAPCPKTQRLTISPQAWIPVRPTVLSDYDGYTADASISRPFSRMLIAAFTSRSCSAPHSGQGLSERNYKYLRHSGYRLSYKKSPSLMKLFVLKCLYVGLYNPQTRKRRTQPEHACDHLLADCTCIFLKGNRKWIIFFHIHTSWWYLFIWNILVSIRCIYVYYLL